MGRIWKGELMEIYGKEINENIRRRKHEK